MLKGFYTVIKSLDAYVRFVLLTGVSKFSRAGVFSGLNNLQDLTMHDRYAAMLGFTEDELQQDFQGYLKAFSHQRGMAKGELLEKIKTWYDGFCFSRRCEHVYNPFSLLLLFDAQEFRNYWFESGTPTFLVKLIKERSYDVTELDQLQADELSFSTYEIENLDVLPLLFQTGYLTIKDYDPETQFYTLSYPNYEVEHAFMRHLLSAFSETTPGVSGSSLQKLVRALQQKDLVQFFEILDAFLAGIDYRLHIKQERYYQSIVYLIFKLIGLQIQAEVRTSRGRIDAVVELEDTIYIFEFKIDSSEEEALTQIKEKGYADPYRTLGKAITLIGVNFDTSERGIAGWQTET